MKVVRRILGLLWLLQAPVAALAAEFQVIALSTQSIDGQIVMDAEIDYRLSDKAVEALQNGVPLTIEVHLQLRREGAWLWERDLLDERLRYRIHYLSLAELYQVEDLQNGTRQNFVTQRTALTTLGRISGLPLLAEEALEAGKRYQLMLRARLDIEALPMPLRPLAYLTPSWNLESSWSRWPLQR